MRISPIFFFLFFLAIIPNFSNAQVLLSADGPGNTYELINSKLAPGFDAIEHAECTSPVSAHPAFGRHIAEVWDSTLNAYVFEFYIHVANDNDRCLASVTDRQRVEIKTYDQSPANLKGTVGETVTYKWKFKIPAGYKPSSSFSHLHQVKPVNGDDDTPLFTLTARKGTPNKLELIYTADGLSGTTKPVIVNLSLFEGVWVEATEVIKVGANGTYYIIIKRLSDDATLLTYSNSNIKTFRPDNSFIRPKWGIYRSLNTPSDLRDEAFRMNDYYIAEGASSSQTYYWTGGTTTKSFTDNTNWNTQLDGGGSIRSIAAPEDILIFDGTNVGGSVPTTGTVTATVTSTSLAQLNLRNNATVIFQSAAGSGNTAIMTLNGDGTPVPDFEISAGSSLSINSPLTSGSINIDMPANVTGLIGGTLSLSNTGTHRITAQTLHGLEFGNGSTFNSDGVPASSAYPFGSNTQSVQFGVIFQSGANLVATGNKSPMGNSSAFQACEMLPGSNYYVRATNAGSTGSYVNLKTFGNIFIQNNATFTSDGPYLKIENLTIDNGCTFITHSSGNTPILGNLVVNGTMSAPGGSTNQVVLGGNAEQTISGSGTITIPTFTIANFSNVTLSKSVVVTTACNVFGKINFGTNSQLTGAGTFTSRVVNTAVNVTGNTTAGSFLVTGVVGTLSSNTGLKINGTGLDANTNVVGFSSSNANVYLSKPALSTNTNVAITFVSDTATLVTANTNGMDNTSGSVIVTGTRSFQSGTNYILNGSTTWPFGISTTVPAVLTVGRVEVNATVTTNKSVIIKNGLFVNSGNFIMRQVDSIQVSTYLFRGQKQFSPFFKEDSNFKLGNQYIVLGEMLNIKSRRIKSAYGLIKHLNA